ncbi:hypothetical protein CYMTET_27245 [Cymbomonas tetramitiformis]|uniref:Uncharacterized protein n=1 Tax=Cymbomonas tetramitiformis TaxID=36881 RepID=A0AAE0KX40_9CHLO|nr:hypothetical protein CYMTET_27245 [Cymbomonas tetramitiformis]
MRKRNSSPVINLTQGLPPPPKLAKSDPFFRHTVNFLERFEIQVVSDPCGRLGGGAGSSLWSAAHVFLEYMAKIPEDHFREKRILEVGSGLGIIGIAAALLGASQVTLTDKACVLDLLKMNVEANVAVSGIRKDVCQVEKLIWGDPHDHTYDTILASDVAYDEREAFALSALAKHNDYILHKPRCQRSLASTVSYLSRLGEFTIFAFCPCCLLASD